MLANQQNPVHGQTVSPQGESFVDRGEYFHPRELLRARPAQIAFRLLIHIERDQVHLGAVMPIPPTVSDQKAIEDVLSMGVAAVLRHHSGNSGAACRAFWLGLFRHSDFSESRLNARMKPA